jgi:adiponectin receptor
MVQCFDCAIMALRWEDLPKWRKDNEYIRSGYRKPSYSSYRSMGDIINLHNETVNIWSHLSAAVLFSIYLIQFLVECDNLSTDVMAVLTFFLGVITCFTLSSIHHLFSNHSKKVMNWTQRLDHLGGVIVIWGSAISFIHFGFYCDRQLRLHYMGVITAAALISMIYVLHPKFRHPNSRLARTLTYFALGFAACLPALHLLIYVDGQALHQRTVLASYRNLIILNSLGGLFYATRIPERFYRKIFDIYGSSHQVMHVLVICGALLYQTGLLATRRYWSNDELVCPAA